jgi:hypothetical protein
MLRSVDWQAVTDVLEEYSTFIYRIKFDPEDEGTKSSETSATTHQKVHRRMQEQHSRSDNANCHVVTKLVRRLPASIVSGKCSLSGSCASWRVWCGVLRLGRLDRRHSAVCRRASKTSDMLSELGNVCFSRTRRASDSSWTSVLSGCWEDRQKRACLWIINTLTPHTYQCSSKYTHTTHSSLPL